MIARELAMALDPALIPRQLGISPDPWQLQALRSPSPRILLNCSRQAGKSETVATIATHESLYRPDSFTLMLSRTERQSQELFRRSLALYRALGRPIPADTENKLTLELANGSRIVALPGNEAGVRGFSGVTLF